MAARERFGGMVAFDTRTTIVNDPGLVWEVLQNDHAFAADEDFLQRRLNVSQVEDIAALRPALSPVLRRTAIQGLESELRSAVRERVRRWCGGPPCDPVVALDAVVAGAVARHFFGGDGDELPPLVGDLLDVLAVVIGNPLAPPPWWLGGVRRRIDCRYRMLLGRVTTLMWARASAPERFDDMATRVLAAGRAEGYALARIAHMLVGALLAAHRVPVAAISWMLMMVAERPAVQQRLRQVDGRAEPALRPADGESQGVHGRVRGEPPVGDYARAVALESLRLYPATWLITRRCSVATSLGGYHLPVRHNLVMSPYVLHRDAAVFDRPERFVADRWLDPGFRPRAYLPFGRGLHRCPGNELAVLAMICTLREVLAAGRLELVGDQRVTADTRTTLTPRGLRLRLTSGVGPH